MCFLLTNFRQIIVFRLSSPYEGGVRGSVGHAEVPLPFCSQLTWTFFRYKHASIRANAEASAFYNAESFEKHECNRLFNTLLGRQFRFLCWKLPTSCKLILTLGKIFKITQSLLYDICFNISRKLGCCLWNSSFLEVTYSQLNICRVQLKYNFRNCFYKLFFVMHRRAFLLQKILRLIFLEC